MTATASDESFGEPPLWILATDSIYILRRSRTALPATVERVVGLAEPTARQGRDGVAKPFEALIVVDALLGTQQIVDEPWVGSELDVTWDLAEGRRTRISTVLATSDRPMWGRSFFIAEPDEERSTGVLLAAGVPVAVTPTIEAAFALAALVTVASAMHPSGIAIGVASAASDRAPTQWTAINTDPVFAEPDGETGWRTPWQVPPGVLL